MLCGKEYKKIRIEGELRDKKIELDATKLANEEIMQSSVFNIRSRMKASEELRNHNLNMVKAEQDALDAQFAEQLISVDEYNRQRLELENEAKEARLAIAEDENEQRKKFMEELYNQTVNLINSGYEAQKRALQEQLNDLKQYYTTSQEEAEKDASKQLISKEELARRELEIKRKMAKAEKEQAIFNVVSSVIQAVSGMLAAKPIGPWNWALSALTAAMGAVQIAQIKSQPLPRYARGKKADKKEGHWAKVGELGPETVWIPQGAAVIPANKSKNIGFDVLREFNIARPEIPARPNVNLHREYFDSRRNNTYVSNNVDIDYDRLGKSVAKYMPHVNQLNVNMDRNGIKYWLQEDNMKTELLNTRYRIN